MRYGGGTVSLLLNLIWILVSGIPLAVTAAANGILLCCTVIGIPFGLQCFKMAKLALMPFGAEVSKPAGEKIQKQQKGRGSNDTPFFQRKEAFEWKQDTRHFHFITTS